MYINYRESGPPRRFSIYSVIVCVARARGSNALFVYTFIYFIYKYNTYIFIYTRRRKWWWWMRFSIHGARTGEMNVSRGGGKTAKKTFFRVSRVARAVDGQQKRHRSTYMRVRRFIVLLRFFFFFFFFFVGGAALYYHRNTAGLSDRAMIVSTAVKPRSQLVNSNNITIVWRIIMYLYYYNAALQGKV